MNESWMEWRVAKAKATISHLEHLLAEQATKLTEEEITYLKNLIESEKEWLEKLVSGKVQEGFGSQEKPFTAVAPNRPPVQETGASPSPPLTPTTKE